MLLPPGSVTRVGRPRLQRRRRDHASLMTPGAEALLALFHDAFDAQQRALVKLPAGAAPGAHRPPRPVRARRRRRRRRPRGARAPACRGRQRGVRTHRIDRRRGSRSSSTPSTGRRTAPRHPVLGDLVVRRRRRRSSVRARRQRRDGGADHRDTRGGGLVRWRPARGGPDARLADSLVVLNGLPARPGRWKQFRALGAAALILVDVAAGRVDGYVDAVADGHAPWDYLGGCWPAPSPARSSPTSRAAASRSPNPPPGASSWPRPHRRCSPSCARCWSPREPVVRARVGGRARPRRTAAGRGRGRARRGRDRARRVRRRPRRPREGPRRLRQRDRHRERAGRARGVARRRAGAPRVRRGGGRRARRGRLARRPARRHRQLRARVPGRRGVGRSRRRRPSGRRCRPRTDAGRHLHRAPRGGAFRNGSRSR